MTDDIIKAIKEAGELMDALGVPTTGRRIRYVDPETGQVIERQIPDKEAPK